MKLKFFGFCVVVASLLSTRAIGEPLVTISCDKPEGFNIAYGVSLTERFSASQNNQPGPTKPSLKGPTKDGYRGKPTFVIDSNKKNMTIGWTLLPEDAELTKQAKEAGLPQLPPVPASDGVVVQFNKEHISAVQADPWSIMTFSFSLQQVPPLSVSRLFSWHQKTRFSRLRSRIVNFRGLHLSNSAGQIACVECPQGHLLKLRKAKTMSALPPKADMCGALAHVCFGPKS